MSRDLLDLAALPQDGVAPGALQAAVAVLAAGLAGAEVCPPPRGDADAVARAALATFGRVRAGYDPGTLRLEAALAALTLDAMDLPARTPLAFTGSGSESLFLGLVAARGPRRSGQVVAGQNIHPATLRACGLLGLEAIRTPSSPKGAADPAAFARARTPDAVALVATATAWADGLSDPIADLAGLAAERGVACVLDACIGGLLQPFTGQGPRLDPPGVSTLAVDLHKFGYAPQNLSAVCYLDPAGAEATAFHSDDWDGFPYRSRGVAGDRPFGPLAAAWVAMLGLGRAGYRARAQIMAHRRKVLAEAVQAAGLSLARTPETVAVCIAPGEAGLDALATRLAAAQAPHIVCAAPGFIRLRVEPLGDAAAFDAMAERLAGLAPA